MEEVHQLTDHVCELMHQVLTDAFRAGSSGGGVPLTNLVCDDERYSATLENIFALSFLVRDGRVRLSRDVELGVMVTLVPRPPREQQQQQRPAVDAAERQQFVMELQHRDWEVMVRIVTASGGSLLPSRGAHDVEGSSGGGSAALRPLGAAAAAALPSGSGGSSSGVGCSRQQAMPRTPVAAGATTAAVVTPPVAAALQSLQTPAAPARPAAQSRLAVVGGSSNGPLPQPALGCSAPVQQLPPLQPNTPQQPRGSPRGPRIDLPPAKRPRLQD